MTDVSSLHDIDDDVDDDVTLPMLASDDRTTSDVTADNLSDLTIPDFTVSTSLSVGGVAQW